MATIRKRRWRSPSGDMQERWQVDFVDQGGKRRHKQFERKKDADAYLVNARGQVATGAYMAESTSPSIAQAAAAWIARGGAEGLERSTIQQRREHVVHILAVLEPDARLARISVTRLEAARDDLLGRHSRATTRKIIVSLRAILRQAKAVHLAAADLVVKGAGRHRKRLEVGVDIPTPDEVRTLVEATSGKGLAMICLAAFAGLRASEIRGLRWADLELIGKRPAVAVTQRADRWQAIGSPKSAAARRTIPLGEITVRALKAWKLEQPHGRSLVFGTATDRPDSLANLRRRLLVGVRYGLHSFRHYAISAWLRTCNGDFKLVQTRAGHASLTLTLDRYGHLLPHGEQIADAERGLFG